MKRGKSNTTRISLLGPDDNGCIQSSVDSFHITAMSSVLHLRGMNPSNTMGLTRQPLMDRDGNMLMLNGEIFEGPVTVLKQENDGQKLMEALQKLDSIPDILALLGALRGPWSIVYYIQKLKCILFGRDMLGRRSLLWNKSSVSDNQAFILSSVGDHQDPQFVWEEVPANGLYLLHLHDSPFDTLFSQHMTLHPWNIPTSNSCIMMKPFGIINTNVGLQEENYHVLPSIQARLEQHMHEFYHVLSHSVQLRTSSIPHRHVPGQSSQQPRLAVLFSGGLDCTALAALAHIHLPPDEPIDLLNVAFENPRSLNAKEKSAKISTKKAKKKKGGVLSVENESLPVENTTTHLYNVPDRQTGRQGFQELCERFPERPWRFVEINVPYSEAMEKRQHVIELAKPSASVMDLSIAIAFWFASRGQGTCFHANGASMFVSRHLFKVIQSDYDSPAKVLFSGLGADEQLGGYGRHKTSFDQRGWKGLIDELQLDLDRISTRNLGRDDRIVSDHGKEVRFPFLDETVIAFLSLLPVYIKTNPYLPKGQGDKFLLRQLVQQHPMVGPLKRTAEEPKRAIQFGAKTAKMTNKDEKGTDLLEP